MIKKIIKYSLMLLALVLTASCEKNSEEDLAKEVGLTTFPVIPVIPVTPDNPDKPDIPTSHGTVIETGVVDLGLSVKWAACNLSTDTYNHFTDNCTGLGSDFSTWSVYEMTYPPASISGTDADHATVLLGSGWRTPTMDEVLELEERCLISYSSFRGYDGIIVTGPSGKTIFIRAGVPRGDYYWTSSYNLRNGKPTSFEIHGGFKFEYGRYSFRDYHIRPVKDK